MHEELQQRASHGAPRRHDREIGWTEPPTSPARDQRRDLRRAPDDGSGVAEEELVMAVQHAQAERAEHQQRGAREEDPHEQDRQLTLRPGEARRDGSDQERRCQNAQQREHGGDERQQTGNGVCDLARFLLVSFGAQRRIHGDERC